MAEAPGQDDAEVVRREYADETGLTVRFALWAKLDLTAEEMRRYVAHSVAHKHRADAVPDFEGTRRVTTSSAVFVAER